MAIYGTYTEAGGIIRASDGVNIPNDPGNREYDAAMKAVLAGDTIAAYVVPPPTPEKIRDATFKADSARVDLATRLKTATPAQIDTWFDANVTNLAQARGVLKAMAKLLATIVRD